MSWCALLRLYGGVKSVSGTCEFLGETQSSDAHTGTEPGLQAGGAGCHHRMSQKQPLEAAAGQPHILAVGRGSMLEGQKVGDRQRKDTGQGEHLHLPQSHGDSDTDSSLPNSWLLFAGCQPWKVSLYLSPAQAAAALGPCLAVFSPITQSHLLAAFKAAEPQWPSAMSCVQLGNLCFQLAYCQGLFCHLLFKLFTVTTHARAHRLKHTLDGSEINENM